MSKLAKKKTESRVGKIARHNTRRQLLASREAFARWDAIAGALNVSFNELARMALEAFEKAFSEKK